MVVLMEIPMAVLRVAMMVDLMAWLKGFLMVAWKAAMTVVEMVERKV